MTRKWSSSATYIGWTSRVEMSDALTRMVPSAVGPPSSCTTIKVGMNSKFVWLAPTINELGVGQEQKPWLLRLRLVGKWRIIRLILQNSHTLSTLLTLSWIGKSNPVQLILTTIKILLLWRRRVISARRRLLLLRRNLLLKEVVTPHSNGRQRNSVLILSLVE